ncbi:MAG: extracellular solute-binding protein [Chloroflexota bacterium]|jgi:multiple sugar transport system substrate-binding protein|nr:extracellular solute-binding protein [Anaerolineae bacterium]HMM27669.1 extracellular solute-binding protein [Aggregatilineaceae bacterium]
MFRKLSLSVALVMVLGAALVALAPVAAQEETVNLRLATWDDENAAKVTQVVLDGFMEKYPNITVVNEPLGDDAHVKLLTQLAAGTAADVVMVDSGFLGLVKDFLMPLDDLIADPEVGLNVDDYYPEILAVGAIDGVQYLLNKDYATTVAIINTGMMEAAGLELPEDGWTYEDYLYYAQLMTLDANGNNALSPDFDPDNIVQYGTRTMGTWARAFQTAIFTFGSHTISPDGTTAEGYINSPEAVAAFEWYRDLVHEYHVAPTLAVADAFEGNMMGDGFVAMYPFYGPWFYTAWTENPDLSFAAVPPPSREDGFRESTICWAGFGLNAATEHPEEAWLLLRELGSEPGQKAYGGGYALSAYRPLMEEAGMVDHPFFGVFLAEAAHVGVHDDALNPHYVECIEEGVVDLLELLLGDEGAGVDPKPYLDEIAAASPECLAQSAE